MTESDCNNYNNGICVLASTIFGKEIKCKKLFDCDFKRKLYNTSENVFVLDTTD